MASSAYDSDELFSDARSHSQSCHSYSLNSQFDDNKRVNVNYEYFKCNFKLFDVKYKKKKCIQKHLHSVFEIQCFQNASTCSIIWCAKFSGDDRFLAIGSQNGILTIYETIPDIKDKVCASSSIQNNFSLKILNETPFHVYANHSSDIIDLDWSCRNYSHLITVSIDQKAILYDVPAHKCICTFYHNGIVSSIHFCPWKTQSKDCFITGCFDKLIRVWNVDNNITPLQYITVNDFITAVAFFPNSNNIVLGNIKGKCSVYKMEVKLVYCSSFDCKNRKGKYKKGRKVTSIRFINDKDALITTNDSRIRLVDVIKGEMIRKYKGMKNNEMIIRSGYSKVNSTVICASERKEVFVWKDNAMEFNGGNIVKNYAYEMFKPFDTEIPICSFFVSDNVCQRYIERIEMMNSNIRGYSVIINCGSNGSIQVLFNCEYICD